MNLQMAFTLGFRIAESLLRKSGPVFTRAEIDEAMPDCILESDFDEWKANGKEAVRDTLREVRKQKEVSGLFQL